MAMICGYDLSQHHKWEKTRTVVHVFMTISFHTKLQENIFFQILHVETMAFSIFKGFQRDYLILNGLLRNASFKASTTN